MLKEIIGVIPSTEEAWPDEEGKHQEKSGHCTGNRKNDDEERENRKEEVVLNEAKRSSDSDQ